jgi:EmrB/QacA subfamily drug resistance transporter
MSATRTDAASRRPGWLPFIVAATFFMEYLDTTIITTALPRMAQDFRVGPNALSLGLTAYMLTLAVFIPVSGWVADRFGSRTVFTAAIVVFTLASVACALSTGLPSFTAARVLQGLGGAMMVPVGRMIVVRNTERSRLLHAISTITWPAVIAPVVGPTVGGFITTYASWHWIFLLNVPFGLAAIVASLALVPQQRAGEARPLDRVGFVLSAATLTALLSGTELASREDASLALALGLILAGVALCAVTVLQARRTAHPLLDFSTLSVPTFSVTVLWGSATRMGVEAVPYLLPLLFQIGFGLSPFRSGLLLLASATGNFGMKAFTTPVLRRFGFRNVAVFNAGLAGLFIIACGLLVPATPLPVLLGLLFLYGLTRSMQFTTLATLAYADIPDAQKGSASTLWSTNQQMTIGMGIAFGAVCLRVASAWRGGHGGALDAAFALGDFHWAFVIAGLLTLVSIIGYARLPRDAGSLIGGPTRRPG